MKVANKHMTFREAVKQTPPLKFFPGLKALLSENRSQIIAKDTQAILGSTDVDEAYRASQPTAPRWDYGIAYSQAHETLYWVEIHPADNSHVNAVIAKAEWLKNWFQGEGRLFRPFPRVMSWVATGRSALTAKDPKRRKLEEAGVKYVGTVLHIPAN